MTAPANFQTNYDWSDIMAFVTEVHKQEGALPNRTHCRMLADQCLREVAEKFHLFSKSWNNSNGGPITVTSNSVTLPADLVSIDSVEYTGNLTPLERHTLTSLDQVEPGWRTASGDPEKYCIVDDTTLLLNTIPTSPATKLTIRGKAYLPTFSDTVSDTNPLQYLPAGVQLIVAYYILAKLPVSPAVPVNDTALAIQSAQAETARRQQVRADYMVEFKEMEAKIGSLSNRRINQPFGY